MKRYALIWCGLILAISFFFSTGWAVCPQDPNDIGICDTFYVEIYPPDQQPVGFPILIRFPMYVTHDVPNPNIDSIAGMEIALCFEHSNPSEYCSLSYYWNKIVFSGSELTRSIFRDLDGIQNWMLDRYEQNPSYVWANIILNLDGTSHFWFILVPTTQPLFGEGSRVLLATMTFRIEDSVTICVDSCMWPPGGRGVCFSRADAVTYLPRHLMPVCGTATPPQPSILCPPNESQHTDGTFQTGLFSASYDLGEVVSVTPHFYGSGISDVDVVYTKPPPQSNVEGYVVYTVTDHCQEGGRIVLEAQQADGLSGECEFNISLTNDPPVLNLPNSLNALTGHMLRLGVNASDPDNDVVSTMLNAFWFETDSLQLPVSPPSYTPGNPGLLVWSPTVEDTGRWLSSFSAMDLCSVGDTNQVSILVGMPNCGDWTGNGIIDMSDLIFLINYLYKNGPPPTQLCRGDGNCDGVRDLIDAIVLIRFLYRGGSAPCFDCCAGGF